MNLDEVTLAELIRLHDASRMEALRCEAEGNPAHHLTEAENAYRSDECKRQARIAWHAHTMVRAKLAAAGQLLFTLAVDTTLPRLIEEAVERLATARLSSWIAAAEREVRKLNLLTDALRAKGSYYESVLANGKPAPAYGANPVPRS